MVKMSFQVVSTVFKDLENHLIFKEFTKIFQRVYKPCYKSYSFEYYYIEKVRKKTAFCIKLNNGKYKCTKFKMQVLRRSMKHNKNMSDSFFYKMIYYKVA